MKLWLGKRNSSPEDFWKWFVANESRIRAEAGNRSILMSIAKELARVHPDLVFEYGMTLYGQISTLDRVRVGCARGRGAWAPNLIKQTRGGSLRPFSSADEECRGAKNMLPPMLRKVAGKGETRGQGE